MAIKSTKYSSYGHILKSSSIMGSSQAVSYLIGLVRTKFLAVLLGPAGVGIAGTLQALVDLLGVLTRCGIDSSGVREIAVEHNEDPKYEARVIAVVRKLAWLSAFLGVLLSILLAAFFSQYLFGSGKYVWPIVALGFGVAITSLSSAQRAVLQGRRELLVLAKIGVSSALLSTIGAISVYKLFGVQGITPVIILSSTLNLLVTWLFYRQLDIDHISMSWLEALKNSKVLISIGLTFMWSALLTACVTFFLRAEVIRELGEVASGIYQAAFGLSALFARFILQAMSADYYPRLAELSNDNERVNIAVNEQTEIGLLIALPGLVMLMAFAHWIVPLLYSANFAMASSLVPWFIMGVFVQLVSWPIGFIQQAKGSARWFFISQTSANVTLFGLSLVFMKLFGLNGLAIAFAAMYLIHLLFVYLIGCRLSGFRWSGSVFKVLVVAFFYIMLTFFLVKFSDPTFSVIFSIPIIFFASVFSLRTLCQRVSAHPVVAKIRRVPGLSFFL